MANIFKTTTEDSPSHDFFRCHRCRKPIPNDFYSVRLSTMQSSGIELLVDRRVSFCQSCYNKVERHELEIAEREKDQFYRHKFEILYNRNK